MRPSLRWMLPCLSVGLAACGAKVEVANDGGGGTGGTTGTTSSSTTSPTTTSTTSTTTTTTTTTTSTTTTTTTSTTGTGFSEIDAVCGCILALSQPGSDACTQCLVDAETSSCWEVSMACQESGACMEVGTCLFDCNYTMECIINCLSPASPNQAQAEVLKLAACDCGFCTMECMPNQPFNCDGQ